MTAPPILIKGSATEEEVAALVAVLQAAATASASAAGQDRPAVSAWASPARQIAPPVAHGPGAWRASALPR